MTVLSIVSLVIAWLALAVVVAVSVGRAARLREKRDARPHPPGNGDTGHKAS